MKTSRPVAALLLGLTATLAVTLGHLVGLDEVAELRSLDLRFRLLSTAPPNDDMVHIDIDDRSLDQLGRPPWPRAQLAGIVDTLRQAGATGIVLDIILPLPQTPRLVSAEADLYQGDETRIVGSGKPLLVLDDDILTTSLRTHGRVFVPMHIDLRWRDVSATRATEAELTRMLTKRPVMTKEEAAGEMGVSPEEITGVFRRAKEAAIDFRVRALLTDQPLASLKTIRKTVLPDLPDDVLTMERDLLRKAYLRRRSLNALGRFSVPEQQIGGYPARTGPVIPPLIVFAQQTHQSGFVTFEPDPDGVVRRIPLLGYGSGKVYPQFAFAAAANELALRHRGSFVITADPARVALSCKDGTRRVIPIDEKGFMLINWRRRTRKETPPRHISAAAVGDIHLQRERIEKNTRLIRHYQLQWAETMGHDMGGLFQASDELYPKLVGAERARLSALLYDPGNVPPAPVGLRQQERQIEHDLDVLLSEVYEDFYLEGASEAQKQLTSKVRRAIARLLEENEEIEKQIAAELVRLRTVVIGKICLIGSTATGWADFVPTPIHKRTPGVMVHSNIFNTIFSGAFVREAHPGLNILVIVAAGVIISLLVATRPVMLQGGPGLILLGGGYSLFNAAVVFHLWGVWLVLVAPIAAMVCSFLIVSAYRQLTEERAKRQIRGMFAHALSPALVDQLIADPSVARLGGERRVLTCFFSDLGGFTTLSERLGEQQMVRVLNRYFDRMTEVIQDRHGGYLNKFLGDGIFAFFGAPVPQEDHSRRALVAALDCRHALTKLNESLTAEIPEIPPLDCRIGITTGEVMVGNCGSTQRMDYTAIGDPVNLASRLDTANKFFETRILAVEETLNRKHADEFFARPLGKVLVVGKNEPVNIWNLLGRAEEATPEQIKVFTDFAHALELFSQRQFEAAAELFESVLKELGDDKPSQIYLDLSRQYLRNPPPEDWAGALQLTEK